MNSEDSTNLSPEEFVNLTLKHESRFFGVVGAMLPWHSQIEDIVQEVITLMWQKSHEFERGTDFAAWGCSIARYKAMEFIRKSRSSEVRLSDSALEMVAVEFEKKSDEFAERAEALEVCIEKLDSQAKRLVALRYQSGMTLKSTAMQFGKSEPTARKLLRQALRQLEHCVNDVLRIEPDVK